MDDGTVHEIAQSDWASLWTTDAAARQAAGLEPLPLAPPSDLDLNPDS